MGSDDLFKKRKQRTSDDLKRKKTMRLQNKRYLVVCEGTKTEPQYFQECLTHLGIPVHIVRIAPNQGVSPNRVVAHALELYNEDAISGDSYDNVYCVFDRDKHATFDAAVAQTVDLTKAGKPFSAVTSTPCFEVWLLLHFGYTSKPFHSAGKKSVGDQVVDMLKTKPGFTHYSKGDRKVYAQLEEKLETAIRNSKKLRAHCIATQSVNPETHIDELIIKFQSLAR